MISKILAGFSLSVLVATSAFAQIASDNAGNYGGGNPWNNGSNGGTGFGVWSLTNNTSMTLSGGNFIGDSTVGAGDVNTSGNSFALFANPNGAFSNADRPFSVALVAGTAFSFDLTTNFRNGEKGFSLFVGATQAFNFNIGNLGGGDAYSINNVDTGLTYDAASVFHVALSQDTLSGGTYTVTRGASSFSGSYTGDATNFRFYDSNTNDGNAANNLYFNNLSITAVPEPSTISFLIGSAVIGLAGFLRHRRKHHALQGLGATRVLASALRVTFRHPFRPLPTNSP